MMIALKRIGKMGKVLYNKISLLANNWNKSENNMSVAYKNVDWSNVIANVLHNNIVIIINNIQLY